MQILISGALSVFHYGEREREKSGKITYLWITIRGYLKSSLWIMNLRLLLHRNEDPVHKSLMFFLFLLFYFSRVKIYSVDK